MNLGLHTGDSEPAVHENRRRLLAAVEISQCAFLHQVHGAEVRAPAGPGDAGVGDVLVTDSQHLALAISTADCLPVVLWNEERTSLAAVHAGWRGLVAGAIEAAGEWLLARGKAASLRAVIGPGIRSCCFQVGPGVADRFPAAARVQHPGGSYVDLAAAARERIASLGCLPEHIEDLAMCTACDAASFYSHRRDRGRTGRHWAVARLAPKGSAPA